MSAVYLYHINQNFKVLSFKFTFISVEFCHNYFHTKYFPFFFEAREYNFQPSDLGSKDILYLWVGLTEKNCVFLKIKNKIMYSTVTKRLKQHRLLNNSHLLQPFDFPPFPPPDYILLPLQLGIMKVNFFVCTDLRVLTHGPHL